jgi:hypothetical protein
VVGSPFTGSVDEMLEGFWTQWAFGHPSQGGIGLADPATQSRRSLASDGQDVEVAVFDTSPFEDPGVYVFPSTKPELETNLLPLMTPKLTLTVQHTLPDPAAGSTVHPPSETSDHGLFVSSLVHAVAPGSEITLIQVLDDDARGTLDTINLAVAKVVTEQLKLDTDPDRGLAHVVLNFSLGFPPPEAAPEPEDFSLDYWATLVNLLSRKQPGHPQEELTDMFEVASFAVLLALAEGQGASIVAAAGNQETCDSSAGSHLPAAFDFVTGVAATGFAGSGAPDTGSCVGLPCYSLPGDVRAPGGDPGADSLGVCSTTLDEDCVGGVIGLAKQTGPYSGASADDGFVYACWAGTSFSSPLVSGLAALLIEAAAGSDSAEDIRTKIGNCAAHIIGSASCVVDLTYP